MKYLILQPVYQLWSWLVHSAQICVLSTVNKKCLVEKHAGHMAAPSRTSVALQATIKLLKMQ